MLKLKIYQLNDTLFTNQMSVDLKCYYFKRPANEGVYPEIVPTFTVSPVLGA